MKNLFSIIIGIALLSCTFSKNEKMQEKENEEFIMYNPSEMTLLMEEMYQKNEQIKQQIIAMDTLGVFPEKFLEIHTATLTDSSDRTANFNAFSKGFILNHQEIFNLPLKEQKEQFNIMVNSCVACHETTCVGPISKIKKLLIN